MTAAATAAASGGLLRALARFCPVPAELAVYDTDLAAAARALRVAPDRLVELADHGLPHRTDPAGGLLFDYDDVMNVGMHSGTGQTGPELALRFLMRFASSRPQHWYEPRDWLVTVRPSRQPTGAAGAPDEPGDPAERAGPDAPDAPDGPDGPDRRAAGPVVTVRAPDLEAPGVRALDGGAGGTGRAAARNGLLEGGYELAVRISGEPHAVRDPRVRPVWTDVVGAMVDRTVTFQTVSEKLRTDHHRAWQLGIADCVVASKVLADRVALRDPRRTVSWREFRREVHAVAAMLAQRLPAGARVLLLSNNRVELPELYFACAQAGTVAVPVNPGLTDREIGHIVEAVEPGLALAEPAGRARLAETWPRLPVLPIDDVTELTAAGSGAPIPAPSHVDGTAPVAILHTSATTGRPKGVVFDQRTVQLNASSWLADVPCPSGTVFLNACPLYHATMVIALHYLAAGGTVCMLDRFTPQGCLAAIERWRVEHAYLVPSMVQLVLEAKGLTETDLSSLRLLVHGAAPMPPAVAEAAVGRLGVSLLTSYGATEAGGPVLSVQADDRPGRPPVPGAACVGAALPGITVDVRDDHGRPLPPGEVGEIHVGGAGLMCGYWRDADATAAVLSDGWLNTRDLGCVDDDGYVWVVDRRNDLILRAGQNVYPAEVEHVLRRSPLLADVAVVPAPSRAWGQTPVAFVQPRPDTGLAEADLISDLVDRCTADLASYKRPSKFVLIERIPRNPAGKILRKVLRERVECQAEEAS